MTRQLVGIVFLLVMVACTQSPEPAATPIPLPTATTAATAVPPTLPPPILTINNTPVPSPTPGLPAGHFFRSPEYGVHLSQWWHVDDVLPHDLEMTREMGFGWVKHNFPWRDVEGHAKGEYDWYRTDRIVEQVDEAGLKLLVRLDHQPLWSVRALPDELIRANQPPVDYQDFGDFCYTLAERYKGRIHAYQVWNEPNLSREWGDQPPNPAEYTELLKLCYEGIKAADPQAIVVSAGLAPTGTLPPDAMPDTDFLQGMYDAGAAAYFDVLGLNAPGYKAPPETSPEEGLNEEWGGGRWFVFRHVEDMRDIMVVNGDENKQVVLLEMGWMVRQEFHPSYTWHGVTEQEQAEYLAGAYQWAQAHWRPWIGLMTTIYMADADWQPAQHEQYWWSIILPDGTPRPAYEALRLMEK
jgi:hypothetical protein